MNPNLMKAKLHFVLSLTMFLSVFSVVAQQSYWKKTESNDLKEIGDLSKLDKNSYQTYKLDIDQLKAVLSNAPLRNTLTTRSNIIIDLPNIDGVLEPFRIVKAPVLSEELSVLHPNINTYLGFSVNNPGTRTRFSVTPHGLQSMTSHPDKPTNFTVPLRKADNSTYIVYSRDARIDGLKDFECLTIDEDLPIEAMESYSRDANDKVLRTFRIAISTTGEYTNFWDDGISGNGDAQEDALAQVVSTLNRSNEVYEVDMAITFVLVTGTEIIFDNPLTDPYTSTGALNGQLQGELTSTVGEANYDVGHLFAYGDNNGNAGCIGCVCVNGSKGRGWSRHLFLDNDGGPYMSDFFDIDYVPHEIGHQMGSLHTHGQADNNPFNFEPGSGTTIMGYAGITGLNDVQDHTDPYFHYSSIDQILTNLVFRNCWTSTPIANNPPDADAGSNYTIPGGTAFVLKGSATDLDPLDVLFYNWEQIDDGLTDAFNFGPNLEFGPVWRSRPPNISPDRYMPIIERVIAGELTELFPTETLDNSSWETVSNVSRSLNFAMTVRDRSEADGVGQFPQSSYDTMSVTVDGTSGPFEVTSPTTNESWDPGTSQRITWNVAGTDTGAVNTPTVNILLSTDGGFTYPFVLATDVPNDGSNDITVPVIGTPTTTARIKVEGNNNIFYAINPIDFSVTDVLSLDDNSLNTFAIFPNPNRGVFTIKLNSFLNDDITVDVHDLKGRKIFNNSYSNTTEFNEVVRLSNVQSGMYLVTVSDGINKATKKIIIE